MRRIHIPESLATKARKAEKEHVARMENTDGLRSKPFPGGISRGIDESLNQIAIFSAMAASIPHGPGARILEVGAGPCWFSHWLQRLGFETCSLDLSHDMLAIGRERLNPGSWQCVGDMANLPFQDETFDAIICCAALHHVPDWQKAIDEFFRVLKQGGVLVLQEPGKGHSQQAESKAQMETFGVLEQDLPPRVLSSTLRSSGFSQTFIRPVTDLSLGRTRIMPPFPLKQTSLNMAIRQRARRLKAIIYENVINLMTPLHLVLGIKGIACADSTRPDLLRARFTLIDIPIHFQAGAPIPLRVQALNVGSTRWLKAGRGRYGGCVRLGISRTDATGKILELDYARIELPRDVEPGTSVEVKGYLPAADQGILNLSLDFVAEGICWFGQRGSSVSTAAIDVVEGSPTPAPTNSPAVSPPPEDPQLADVAPKQKENSRNAFTQILRCPATHEALSYLAEEKLGAPLFNPMSEKFKSALVTRDGRRLYPVHDGIPDLLVESGIPVTQNPSCS